MIDRIFTGQSKERGTRVTKICQIAINSCEKGLVTGRVQNAFINHLERFKGTIGLADAMVRLFEAGVGENDSGKSLEGKIISDGNLGFLSFRREGSDLPDQDPVQGTLNLAGSNLLA